MPALIGAVLVSVVASPVSAQAVPDVVANDDSGVGFSVAADGAITTGDVLANDTNQLAVATTEITSFNLDGNAIQVPITTSTTAVDDTLSPIISPMATGTASGSVDGDGISATVDLAANDTRIDNSTGIGGAIAGTVTWPDVLVSGPSTTANFAAQMRLAGSLLTIDPSFSGTAQIRAGLSVRVTPPGGGQVTVSVVLPGAEGANQTPPAAYDRLLATAPTAIDTNFPVSVTLELRVEASIRTGFSSTEQRDLLAQMSAALDDASGTVFLLDPGFTASSASAGVSDNQFATGPEELVVESFDTSGTQGVVTSNGDGTFEYDPNGAFDSLADGAVATDTFTYRATDGFGNSDEATVTIEVTGVAAPATTTTTTTTNSTTTTTTTTTTTVVPATTATPTTLAPVANPPTSLPTPSATLPATGRDQAGPIALLALVVLSFGGGAVVISRRPS